MPKKITDDGNSLFEFAALPNINKPADEAGKPQTRRFSGIGYSGEMIPNHYWWGNVIFDLSSISTPAKAFPALVNHDGDKIAGYIDEFEVSPTEGVKIGGPLIYADGYQGKYVADGSDAGFPWQMSVCIKPGSIEEVQAGQDITVNGRSLQGPITVFRNSRLSEVSFTPTGWDSNTSAAAMSRANNPHYQPQHSPHEETTMSMTAEEKAAFDKAQADLTAANAKITQMSADADAEKARVEAARLATRTAAVTTLFADLKRDVKPDAPEFTALLGLDDTSFSAVTGLMKVAAPTPPTNRLNPALFSSVADKGKDTPTADAAKAGEHGLVATAMARTEQMSQRKSH